jgi:THO complex subunit 2
MGPARDPVRAESFPTDTNESLKARAIQAWQKLVTIIGYFDLDPVRVLDIILDAFSSHVVTHWPFFLQLLHCSPWMRQPLPRRAGQSNIPNPPSYLNMTFDEILATAEGVSPGPVPEDVNACANLLGFKFKYYQVCSDLFLRSIAHTLAGTAQVRPDRSHVRGRFACEGRNDSCDRYPSSRMLLVLASFYPLIMLLQLAPEKAGMDALGEKYAQSLRKRLVSVQTTSQDKNNALANAGTLTDDTLGPVRPRPQATAPPPPPKPSKKKEVKVDLNSHRDFVIALLSVGALRPAMEGIGQYPWMLNKYPRIADILLFYVEHALTPVYGQCCPSSATPIALDAYSASKGQHDEEEPRVVRTHVTFTFPEPPPTLDVRQVYFYQEWSKFVPVCSTLEDIPFLVEPVLSLIGVQAFRNQQVIVKLCRLAKQQLESSMV